MTDETQKAVSGVVIQPRKNIQKNKNNAIHSRKNNKKNKNNTTPPPNDVIEGDFLWTTYESNSLHHTM